MCKLFSVLFILNAWAIAGQVIFDDTTFLSDRFPVQELIQGKWKWFKTIRPPTSIAPTSGCQDRFVYDGNEIEFDGTTFRTSGDTSASYRYTISQDTALQQYQLEYQPTYLDTILWELKELIRIRVQIVTLTSETLVLKEIIPRYGDLHTPCTLREFIFRRTPMEKSIWDHIHGSWGTCLEGPNHQSDTIEGLSYQRDSLMAECPDHLAHHTLHFNFKDDGIDYTTSGSCTEGWVTAGWLNGYLSQGIIHFDSKNHRAYFLSREGIAAYHFKMLGNGKLEWWMLKVETEELNSTP